MLRPYCGPTLARALVGRVTSRSLGSLAPGYAASDGGMRVYAVLLAGLGSAVGGVGLAPASPALGVATIALGFAIFVVASVLIIIGEFRS